MSDRVPVSRPCPDRVPGTVQIDRVHRVPAPTRGRDTGHGLRGHLERRRSINRVPGRRGRRKLIATAELERWLADHAEAVR